METLDQVWAKIRKLLALEESAKALGSLEEAANAASKVQSLILKYNLDLAKLPEADRPEGNIILSYLKLRDLSPRTEGKWLIYLFNFVCKYNLCRVLIEGAGDSTIILIVGTKVNIDLSVFLTMQLCSTIKTLARKAWLTHKNYLDTSNKNTFLRSFYEGAALGVRDRLRESAESVLAESNEEMGLMIRSENTRIDSFISETFGGNLERGKRRGGSSSRDGSSLGYKAGKSLQIRRGVSDSTNNVDKLR